jgi:hypothetical protein
MTSEPSLQERYSQAFRDDTGESFAAITEPDIVLSGSIFSRPIGRHLHQYRPSPPAVRRRAGLLP